MKKIKSTTVKKIVFTALSVIISVALAFILVVSTTLSTCRSYLTSEAFSEKIDSTNLSTLTFIYNGQKVTLEQYVKNYITAGIEEHIKNNPLSDYTDFLYPFADYVTDFAVDKAFSSEFINSVVKKEVHEIVDYYLYSDVEEAEKRIRLGLDIHMNPDLNPNFAKNFEERVSAEVKLAVFQYIEDESGKSTDEIIVLLSEKTLESYQLKTISLILFLLLATLNISSPVNILGYFSGIAFGYFGTFLVMQNDFSTHFAQNYDLISYDFLKPLVDELIPYSDKALIIGIGTLAVFIALKVLIFVIKKKKAQKTTAE